MSCSLVVEEWSIARGCVGVVVDIGQGWLCHRCKLKGQGKVRQDLCLCCDLGCCSWLCSPEPGS